MSENKSVPNSFPALASRQVPLEKRDVALRHRVVQLTCQLFELCRSFHRGLYPLIHLFTIGEGEVWTTSDLTPIPTQHLPNIGQSVAGMRSELLMFSARGPESRGAHERLGGESE